MLVNRDVAKIFELGVVDCADLANIKDAKMNPTVEDRCVQAVFKLCLLQANHFADTSYKAERNQEARDS